MHRVILEEFTPGWVGRRFKEAELESALSLINIGKQDKCISHKGRKDGTETFSFPPLLTQQICKVGAGGAGI